MNEAKEIEKFERWWDKNFKPTGSNKSLIITMKSFAREAWLASELAREE
jgi:hypothetical protein